MFICEDKKNKLGRTDKNLQRLYKEYKAELVARREDGRKRKMEQEARKEIGREKVKRKQKRLSKKQQREAEIRRQEEEGAKADTKNREDEEKIKLESLVDEIRCLKKMKKTSGGKNVGGKRKSACNTVHKQQRQKWKEQHGYDNGELDVRRSIEVDSPSLSQMSSCQVKKRLKQDNKLVADIYKELDK